MSANERRHPSQEDGAVQSRSAAERYDQPTLSASADTRLGVQRAEDNRDPWWWGSALRAIQAVAATGRDFEPGFELELLGLPAADHAARYGALVRHAVRQGIIRRVGYAPSQRASRSGGIVGIYRSAR